MVRYHIGMIYIYRKFCTELHNLFRLPGPVNGLSLSSHNVTPSQAQIFLEFSNNPAERAMIPQASLNII